MNIPQFLYVPRINTLGTDVKLVLETKKNIFWQVFEADSYEEAVEFLHEKMEFFRQSGARALAIHKKYPVILVCLKTDTIEPKRLEKLGEMACDWYVQFYLENKQLSTPKFDTTDSGLAKAAKYFTHWRWGDNQISHQGAMTLINLEYGLSIHFKYGDTIFESFEDFENGISDVQFLSGVRPEADVVRKLLVDAWNFMGIEERLNDGYGLDDIDDEIFG